MSLFEIIGELINPGPVGKVEFKDTRQAPRKKFVPLRFALSMVLLGCAEYLFLFQPDRYTDPVYLLKVNSIIAIYLLIAFRIRIKANTNNMGWVPFLIDNPFRISDDINRFMVILNLLFMPGKYISRSIIDFYKYCKNK